MIKRNNYQRYKQTGEAIRLHQSSLQIGIRNINKSYLIKKEAHNTKIKKV